MLNKKGKKPSYEILATDVSFISNYKSKGYKEATDE